MLYWIACSSSYHKKTASYDSKEMEVHIPFSRFVHNLFLYLLKCHHDFSLVDFLTFDSGFCIHSHQGVKLLSHESWTLRIVTETPSMTSFCSLVNVYSTLWRPVSRSRLLVASRWLKHFAVSLFLWSLSWMCLQTGHEINFTI